MKKTRAGRRGFEGERVKVYRGRKRDGKAKRGEGFRGASAVADIHYISCPFVDVL